MHVGNHARDDKERARHRQYPSHGAFSVPKQDADAKQHGNERNAEAACAPEIPVGGDNAYLVCEEIASYADHDAANQKLAQPARGPACIAKRTVCHKSGKRLQGTGYRKITRQEALLMKTDIAL